MPKRISRHALQRWMASERPPILVEALGGGFYADAHLPGAVNMPPGRVDVLASALLPDCSADIVVYCTSTCTSSDAVARRLEELGYAAVAVYIGGKEEWAEHGLPLERLHSDAG